MILGLAASPIPSEPPHREETPDSPGHVVPQVPSTRPLPRKRQVDADTARAVGESGDRDAERRIEERQRRAADQSPRSVRQPEFRLTGMAGVSRISVDGIKRIDEHKNGEHISAAG